MENKFTINGKEYVAAKLNFNTIADMSDMGIDMLSGHFPVVSAIRAYFAVCAGLDKEDAGNEIDAHIMAGGNLEELLLAFRKESEVSGFTNPAKIKPVKKAEK